MNHIKPGIDEQSPHVAYHCGRLMAALAEIQRRAQPDVGVGIVQRYYASASSTPALVFGRLIRGSHYHLDKIDSPGLIWHFENTISTIMQTIGSSMPATLDLEGQTLFALGYYHQLGYMRQYAKEAAAARAADKDSPNSSTEGDTDNV